MNSGRPRFLCTWAEDPMNRNQPLFGLVFVSILFVVGPARADIPNFVTRDPRLPNPDHPYVMISETVQFPKDYGFGLYDLKFQATKPSQLDALSRNQDGNWEFESIFDLAYEAWIGFGLGPVHRVTGTGTAHMFAEAVVAPASIDSDLIVLDTELIALNLVGLSSDPAFLFRESPTLRSSGVMTVEDACPACAGPLPIYRISSYLDIYAEVSADGGDTWVPGDKSFRVVQQSKAVPLGDYNENGIVDAADVVVWRKNDGTQQGYDTWRANFGKIARSNSGATANAAVPEPETGVLLLLWTIAVSLRTAWRSRDRAT